MYATLQTWLHGSAEQRLAYRRVRVGRDERFFASILFAWGVHLLLWPHALAAARSHPVAWMLSERAFMLLCLLVGGARLWAIITAGRWKPWCAHIRALGAVAGCLIWSQVAFAIMLNSWPNLSIWFWMYAGAAFNEGWTIWRALTGAKGDG